MDNLLQNNIAKISGKVADDYKFYHNTKGEDFLIINVDVKRMSGEVDTLPVVVSEKLLTNDVRESEFVSFEGQIRTFNKHDGSVDIYVFAKDAEPAENETNINEVKLRGFLCKKGRFRTTFTNRKVIDFILAVNRFHGKSDYVPILAWGKDSKFVYSKDISTEFEIVGRFQSRKYTKKDGEGNKGEHVAFEISSSQVIGINK